MRPSGPADYEAYFEAAPDGLLVVDHAGRVVLVNRRAERILCGGRGDLLGAAFADVMAGSPPEACAALLAAGSDAPTELVVRLAGGEVVEATAGRAGGPGGPVV